MQNVFIFHGTAGYPLENWFPWLKEKLEAKGLRVMAPQFPTPEGQSLENWLKFFEAYRNKITDDSIIIGHSLGGVFLLKLLEMIDQPIKLAVFVGTPIGVRPILNYDKDANFAGFDFEWKKIKSNAKNFLVYQSDNDPYVGLGNGEELAKHLEAELSFIPNAGHFNDKAGYTKFEDLLAKLQNYF